MINILGPEYWNNRYQQNDFSWDIGEISTPLKTYFDQLTNKNAAILIPGAGNGYEAEYLFNMGFNNIYICDVAPIPLENFSRRCPTFNKENLLQIDFFELEKIGFDLIIEQTFFCAIHPHLRKKYALKTHSLLNQNGRLVGLLFNDKLNSDKPPFGGNKEEYLNYFAPYYKLNTFETCYNSIKPRAGGELFINLIKKDTPH